MRRTSYVLLCAVTLAVRSAALAASIPENCEATKHTAAGKVAKCLHDAERKRVTSGDLTKYAAAVAKCTAKFSAGWQKAEQKALDAGGACPTMGDEAAVLGSISARIACLTSELETGTGTCLACGNGVLDAGEDCDFGTLGGATCASASGGTLAFGRLACGTDCTFDTSACSSCPPGGQIVGGSCWILSGADESCNTACTGVGLAYDTATLTYAGSSGTNANCAAVLLALNQPGGAAVGTAGPTGGMGCWCATSGGCNREAMFTTTGGASFPSMQRACACQ